ncbi:MAG: hypothetical protein CMC18_03395 [Flavobacteriaceae bacterium]|nr:hypothetical protein [Flavobacteriaceae bacterium]
MYSIIYRSVADDSFSLSDIYDMLSKARERNFKQNITGCLLYHENGFLQLLEGERKDVLSLYEKISEDNRHHTVELIIEEKQSNRLFRDWSMAFFEFEAFESKAAMKLMQIDQIFKHSKAHLVNTSLTKTFFDQARSMLL